MNLERSAVLTGRAAKVVRAAMTCALALLIGACASYEPRPLDPALEFVSLLSRKNADYEVTARSPGRPEWFPLQAQVALQDGLSLGEANALALFHAPAILRARSAERVAGAQLLEAGLLSNPELFAGPRLSTLDASLILPASLSWRLPLYGEQAARQDLAGASLEAARQAVLDAELELLVFVREQFVRLSFLARRLAALNELEESSARVLEWVEGLHRAGSVDTVTLFLARLEQDEARAQTARLRAERDRERRRLLEGIGLLPGVELDVDRLTETSELPELSAPDRDRLLGHPRLRTAHAAYQAAEQALRLEITRQYPDLRLGPEVEFTPLETSVGLGLGVELPLFDRNQAGIARAQELRRAAADLYRDTLLEQVHREAQARADWQSAREMLTTSREGALRSADQAALALDLRLRTGEAQVLEVLTALKAITRSRTRELELNQDENLARLRAATAGGLVLQEPTPLGSPDEER